MKLKIKPLNDIARELYADHGHFHDGDAGLDLYVLEDQVFVPGETTSSGIDTTGTSYFNDVEVSGDLDVSGDLVYDEATARNWNVTGIATAAQFHIGVGGTDIHTALGQKASIGLAIALG